MALLRILVATSLAASGGALVDSGGGSAPAWLRLLVPPHAPPLATLAAQQLRRYVHALDRRLPAATIEVTTAAGGDACAAGSFTIALGSASPPSAGTSEAYFLVSLAPDGCSAAILGGAEGRGVLDGATTLLAALGARLTAEGALLPPSAAARARRAASGVVSADERAAAAKEMAEALAVAARRASLAPPPAFEYRGFQPWGSYPMGNDWWDVDEYRRVVEVIVGLRGNWMGMHSYPRGYAFPEPGVAVLADRSVLLPDGNLTAAPDLLYAATWAATTRPSWGNDGEPASHYCCGAAPIFESDCFANYAVAGGSDAAALCPAPTTPEAVAETYNRVGALYAQVFAFARALGVSTALGTEIPLTLPPQPPDALVPLLVWWSAVRNDTFVTPTKCAECPDGAYVLLGAAGYIYQSPGPGRVALNCYYAPAYLDALLAVDPPSDPAYSFVRLEGYALSAAGPGALPLVQEARNYSKAALGGGEFVDTWAVTDGPPWDANASAHGYFPLAGEQPMAWVLADGPAPGAAIVSAYNATFSRLERLYGSNLTWYWAWTSESWQWSKVMQSDPLVAGVLGDAAAIEAVRASSNLSFGVALGGWQLGPWDNRSYFDAHLPADWPMASLDAFGGGGFCAPGASVDSGDGAGAPPCGSPDPGFANVTRRAQRWSHPWSEDDNDLTAAQLWVGRNLAHARLALALNVTGHQSLQWRTRTVAPQLTAVADFAFNTSLDAADFWRDYALALFGPSISSAAAEILISVDSEKLPRPVHCDPGCLQPTTDCNWRSEYAFVDSWLSLNATLRASAAAGSGRGPADAGADAGTDAAAVERFEYFAAHFLTMRGMRRAECDWAAFGAVLAALQAMPAGPAREAATVSQGFPALASLAANLSQMMHDQLATVATYGELATTTQLHSSVDDAMRGAAAIAALAGGTPLPTNCSLAPAWDPARPPLLRVLTARTVLLAGEALNLRALIVGDAANFSVAAFTRPLGSGGAFAQTPMPRAPAAAGIPRSVFFSSLPAPTTDLEYYVGAVRGDLELFFPPDAPHAPATVVVLAS